METSQVLPETGRSDVLQLLVQEPTMLYMYWDISDRKKRMTESHFQRDWDSLTQRIRVYDVTHANASGEGVGEIWEFAASAEQACYFREAQPARAYAADFGVANAQGRFIPLLRSNTVTTPWISVEQAEAWMKRGADGGAGPAGPAAEPMAGFTLLPDEYVRFSAYTVY